MCGIAGIWSLNKSKERQELARIVQHMTRRLAHRGPDGEDIWLRQGEPSIALGHRRLAVLDLSQHAAQPMHSKSGRYTLTFNGEIYNYRSIAQELQALGHQFVSSGDTEVLLAAIEQWGISDTLTKLNGMFAFGLWDEAQQDLYLARDRMGEKPLYYGTIAGDFVFASELKAFFGVGNFSASLNPAALEAYFSYGYVPAPLSIYQYISKLPPGTFLQVGRKQNAEPETYWSPETLVHSSLRKPFCGSEEEALNNLAEHLEHAVALRMASDVPVGTFLSGGIDSPLITVMAQKHTAKNLKTFSIGFDDQAYNEASRAQAIAKHLGTEHTELYITPDMIKSTLPTLPEMFDEPFADSSQIPTYLVAHLARQHVKVALSGDGGDELFGGYHHYLYAHRYLKYVAPLPRSLQIALAHTASFSARRKIFPRLHGKLHRLADLILFSDDMTTSLLQLRNLWHHPEHFLRPPAIFTRKSLNDSRMGDSLLQNLMYADLIDYLPNDILVKLDRACMHASLEGRVPFLDPAVVGFAWSLPTTLKIHRGQGKYILRRLLARYLPAHLVAGTKMGFGLPLAAWLRGPLREWASDLLSPATLQAEGIFAPASIERRWQEHLSGKRDWRHSLWAVLMFRVWQQKWSSPVASSAGPSDTLWVRDRT